MSLLGKDSTIAIEPTVWGTAATVGALDGILPVSVDPIILKGEIDFDDSSGLSGKTNFVKTQDNANQTVVMPLRWRGKHWTFLAHWFGTDVNTGASPFLHTMTVQQIPAIASTDEAITLAWRGDSAAANSVAENPSLIPQNITLEPDGGFWNMSTTNIGYTIAAIGGTNPTPINNNTSLGAVTYDTEQERLRFKANALRRNLQSGGALTSSDNILDVSNVIITLDRPYDEMKDVLLGSSTLDAKGAKPIQSDDLTVTLAYDQKTYDFETHRNDLANAVVYKSNIIMTETVGGFANIFQMEFSQVVAVDPQVAIERGQRITMSHNFMCTKSATTPTGNATSNEVHLLLTNGSNISYITNV